MQKFQACNRDFKRSEWTPEEDQMLSQLVQEMRVGEHIPYRKSEQTLGEALVVCIAAPCLAFLTLLSPHPHQIGRIVALKRFYN